MHLTLIKTRDRPQRNDLEAFLSEVFNPFRKTHILWVSGVNYSGDSITAVPEMRCEVRKFSSGFVNRAMTDGEGLVSEV